MNFRLTTVRYVDIHDETFFNATTGSREAPRITAKIKEKAPVVYNPEPWQIAAKPKAEDLPHGATRPYG